MWAKTCARNFWKVTFGEIGYIEASLQRGWIFQNNAIFFKNSSSNLASSEANLVSTEKLPAEQQAKLVEYMNLRVPVFLEGERHVLGLPENGSILLPYYALSITPITHEKISVQALQEVRVTSKDLVKTCF